MYYTSFIFAFFKNNYFIHICEYSKSFKMMKKGVALLPNPFFIFSGLHQTEDYQGKHLSF